MDFKKLTRMIFLRIDKKSIIRYKHVKLLCERKYKNHKKGCPNKEKCKEIPYFDDIKEVHKNFYYLLIADFNFKKYKELRKIEHSDWTKDQIKCLLYWQNSIKKLLKIELEKNFKGKDIYVLGCGNGFNLSFQNEVFSMESTCINVFSTYRKNGIKYDIKTINNVKLCCLICSNDDLFDLISYYCNFCKGKGYYMYQPLPLNYLPAGNYKYLGNEIKKECPICNMKNLKDERG